MPMVPSFHITITDCSKGVIASGQESRFINGIASKGIGIKILRRDLSRSKFALRAITRSSNSIIAESIIEPSIVHDLSSAFWILFIIHGNTFTTIG